MADLFERYPPPGQLIPVNHHKLHIQHLGSDGPTVVFEAGQAGFSLDWMLVQPEVSRFAQTYSYDRAGLGWSEAGPHPRTPQQVVAELHTLLLAAQVKRPYILVAHSMGGRYAHLYADQYPEDVIGLVFVDVYHEAFDMGLSKEQLRTFLRSKAMLYRSLDLMARLGVAQLLGQQMIGLLGASYRNMPLQERKRYAVLSTRPKAMATTIHEQEQLVARLSDDPSGLKRSDMPLRVLTHGKPWSYPEYERVWQESQRQAATWSSRSKLVVAEQSDHSIMLAQPKLVIDTIREITEEARA